MRLAGTVSAAVAPAATTSTRPYQPMSGMRYPTRSGYGGKAAHSAATSARTAATSPSSVAGPERAHDQVGDRLHLGGPMPAVVSAAVPRRRPEVRKGERGSSGIVLRLHVMPARSSTSWASLPVSSSSKARRSTSTMWLSVPPETSRNPCPASASASAAALATTCAAYRRNSGRRRLGEGHRLGRDDVLERATLEPGEHRAVDLLGQVVAAQDGAAARAAQGLVGGEGDDVGDPDRARVGAAGDEAGRVRGVEHEEGADRVGDLPEGLGVDDPGVGGRAGDDQRRLLRLGQVRHLVEVDDLAGVRRVLRLPASRRRRRSATTSRRWRPATRG